MSVSNPFIFQNVSSPELAILLIIVLSGMPLLANTTFILEKLFYTPIVKLLDSSYANLDPKLWILETNLFHSDSFSVFNLQRHLQIRVIFRSSIAPTPRPQSSIALMILLHSTNLVFLLSSEPPNRNLHLSFSNCEITPARATKRER